MKEAAGEANMTVITIVLIGVVAGVGLLLIPRLMKTVKAKACCTDGGFFISGTRCCDPNYGSDCADPNHRVGLNASNFPTAFDGKFSECMGE